VDHGEVSGNTAHKVDDVGPLFLIPVFGRVLQRFDPFDSPGVVLPQDVMFREQILFQSIQSPGVMAQVNENLPQSDPEIFRIDGDGALKRALSAKGAAENHLGKFLQAFFVEFPGSQNLRPEAVLRADKFLHRPYLAPGVDLLFLSLEIDRAMEKALAAVRACIDFYELFCREPGEIHHPFSSTLILIISLFLKQCPISRRVSRAMKTVAKKMLEFVISFL
jgi:hypothetical protein